VYRAKRVPTEPISVKPMKSFEIIIEFMNKSRTANSQVFKILQNEGKEA
jgi:hypothetical protein